MVTIISFEWQVSIYHISRGDQSLHKYFIPKRVTVYVLDFLTGGTCSIPNEHYKYGPTRNYEKTFHLSGF